MIIPGEKIVELKLERLRVSDQIKAILDRAESEKRALTADEERQHKQHYDRIDKINHEIVALEVQEQREAEQAAAAWRAGKRDTYGSSGVRFFSGDNYHDHGDAQYSEERALRSDQSFATYHQVVHGLEQRDDLTFGGFVRALVTGPRTEAERRALGEGSDAAGGATVPDYLAANFIDRLRSAMPTIGFGARTVPLTSDNLSIARTVSDPTVAWRSESGAVGESDPVFERVTFTPRSLAAYCKVSRELMEDATNIEEALTRAFVGATAAEVERVALAGTGTPPQPRGIRNTTNVNEVSQGTNGLAFTNWDNTITLIQNVWEDNEQAVTGMVMAPRTLGAILKLKEATTNAPLQEPPTIRDIPKAQSTAVGVAETQGSSSNASTLYLGNWSRLLYGFRNQARIEVLRETFAANLQYMFLVHLRADVQLEHPESFGRLIGIIP